MNPMEGCGSATVITSIYSKWCANVSITMNREQAIAECNRWLAYLDRQKEKSDAMQRIAADRRQDKCTADEARRRVRALDEGVKVYDGARLADAVRVLIK